MGPPGFLLYGLHRDEGLIAMPKGDIELPRQRARDARLGPKRLSASESMDVLQMDLDPRPDWMRKMFGGETRAQKQARWSKGRGMSRGGR